MDTATGNILAHLSSGKDTVMTLRMNVLSSVLDLEFFKRIRER